MFKPRIESLGQLKRTLEAALPREMEKASRYACSDAAKSARSEGNAIARDAYTAKSKRKVTAKIRQGKEQCIVLFQGEVGEPIRHFEVSPKGPGSRPPEGLTVRVKKGGPKRPIRGSNGQKTFWFRGRNGNLVIGYRKSERRDSPLSTEGLVAASPIQAVTKEENSKLLAAHAEERLRERLIHQMERVLKGEIR